MLLCCMETIKDVFLSFHQSLKDLYDSREIEAIALLVIEEITGITRAKLKAFPEDNVGGEAIEKIQAVLDELKTGKPVQYILGSTEFYGLNFLVNPATLIPRPETEELVDWILVESQKLKVESQQPLTIFDIGTGSGCIAISLKKNLPDAQVTAIDISAHALHTAAQNAVINEVKIDFIEHNILDIEYSENRASSQEENNSACDIQTAMFNIIVSNPPYVTLADKSQMHQNVTDFEPHSALFVPEDDPLIFYKAIVKYATGHLFQNSMLFFEINENHGKEVIELLTDKYFINIELRKDISGRDRMVKAIKS
jgi:release factor glutamine methyltransferase